MELPPRKIGDQLLAAGEHVAIRRRLRAIASRHDLACVIACAFDRRTRMLPFFFADLRMAPAGSRAIASALLDSGFEKTRLVLQQWNRHFQPSLMRLDGRMPDVFLISTMSLHADACKAMIRDVAKIEPARRPLVIVGGSMCIYEPWEAFGGTGLSVAATAATPVADLAVTGEEYVLLNLLEVLLSGRAGQEPIRQTFLRARDSGALDAIPGLLYPRTDSNGQVLELVDTGIQRLLGDLDELPMPDAGYSVLEAPSRRKTLASQPLATSQVCRHSHIGSLVMTFGCKFHCQYCPIPGYNQRMHRCKSGERLTEEMHGLYSRYGMRYFFGTDDNFFNDKRRALDIAQSLYSAQYGDLSLHRKIRWGTEVTIHDTLAMREHLPLMYKAGVRALWVGVEDMSGALVRKGQGYDKTTEALSAMRDNGILPMPMMMHHDAQPLVNAHGSRTEGAPANSGLLNQVKLLRRAGAASLQVLMLTPSAGSKSFEETFESGMVFRGAGRQEVLPRMYDGNFVIASNHAKPWRKQWNLMLAYLYFYNPLRLIGSLVSGRGPLGIKPAGMQLLGMGGLLYTIRRTLGWSLRLMVSPIRRWAHTPGSPVPMRAPDGSDPAHARGTPGKDTQER